ncbi:MAG: DUF892 family protein [Pseudomonadota bacterium]
MTIETLHDVYIDQLQDIYSANRQSLDATSKLAELATDDLLKEALQRGVSGIKTGTETVEKIIITRGAEPTGEFCKGMEGLVKEVHAHVIETDFSDKDVRDAMIITQYQRMVHYALAAYGCVVAFAKRLDLSDEAERLQKCLDDTYSGDKKVSVIAEGRVNASAGP